MSRHLRAAWQAWKRIAEKIVHFQQLLLWSLLYFVVVGPFALVVKLASDPLRMKRKSSPTWWVNDPRQTLTLEDGRRQS